MFIRQKYEDGSCSYGYERGDRAILTSGFRTYDLYGGLIKEFKAGEILTISYRGSVSGTRLIPDILEHYSFKETFESKSGSHFKPEDPTLEKPMPHAYVVRWKEGNHVKYTLVAARTAKEARKLSFNNDYFTKERMAGIEIQKTFRKGKWELPEGERWISIRPLA